MASCMSVHEKTLKTFGKLTKILYKNYPLEVSVQVMRLAN